jgi:hypothetical protein
MRQLKAEEREQGIALLRKAVETLPPWAGFRCTLLMTEYEAAVVLGRMEKFFAELKERDV